MPLHQDIVRFLANDPELTTLDVYDRSVGVEGAEAIGQGLQHNTHVIELLLNDNNIGDEGAKAICEGNAVLTELNLDSNSIGDEGAKAIGHVLKHNTHLTTLHLYRNNIGDEGAKTICHGLKKNSNLTFVHLGGNNIGDAGVKAIGQGMKNNTCLTALYLDDHDIGGERSNAIRKLMKRNNELAAYLPTVVCQLHMQMFAEIGALPRELVEDVLRHACDPRDVLTYSGFNTLRRMILTGKDCGTDIDRTVEFCVRQCHLKGKMHHRNLQ